MEADKLEILFLPHIDSLILQWVVNYMSSLGTLGSGKGEILEADQTTYRCRWNHVMDVAYDLFQYLWR